MKDKWWERIHGGPLLPNIAGVLGQSARSIQLGYGELGASALPAACSPANCSLLNHLRPRFLQTGPCSLSGFTGKGTNLPAAKDTAVAALVCPARESERWGLRLVHSLPQGALLRGKHLYSHIPLPTLPPMEAPNPFPPHSHSQVPLVLFKNKPFFSVPQLHNWVKIFMVWPNSIEPGRAECRSCIVVGQVAYGGQ